MLRVPWRGSTNSEMVCNCVLGCVAMDVLAQRKEIPIEGSIKIIHAQQVGFELMEGKWIVRRGEVEKSQRADLRPWSWVSKASAGTLVGLGIGEMGRVPLWRALHIQQKHLYIKKEIGRLSKILRRKHWKNMSFCFFGRGND